jgi:hypothetical protein
LVWLTAGERRDGGEEIAEVIGYVMRLRRAVAR